MTTEPPALTTSAEPSPSLVTLTDVIYGLHAFSLVIGIVGAATIVGSFLIGWPSIIAVILNYVKRSEARGTCSSRISAGRSARSGSGCCGWRSVALCVLFVVATLGIGIFIAWLPLGIVSLWFIYRIARGWLALMDHRPMYT